MHIFHFPWKKIQGNLFASVGQETRTSSFAFALVWETSSTNIHKIVKSANDNPTQTKYQNNNLLRRHAIDWSLFRRDIHRPRHNNLPSATSRICHKLEKVLC